MLRARRYPPANDEKVNPREVARASPAKPIGLTRSKQNTTLDTTLERVTSNADLGLL